MNADAYIRTPWLSSNCTIRANPGLDLNFVKQSSRKTNYRKTESAREYVKWSWHSCRPALKWDFNCSISTLFSTDVADIQELTSIVSFRRRRWSQRNSSENRNVHGNQSKDILSKIRLITKKYFSCLPTLALPSTLDCINWKLIWVC